MNRPALPIAALAMVLAFAAPATAQATRGQATRVQVTGEVVDTFCNVSEIMFATGTAHYQCAVWCAIGGVPVSIRAKSGEIYMVLRIEEEESNVSNPKLFTIMAREVTVDGDLIRRDGVNYLLVSRVATDQGIVNLTHEEHGIQPFGQ
jgi:hypothetical protein